MITEESLFSCLNRGSQKGLIIISLSFENIQTGNLNSNEGIEGGLCMQLNIFKKLFPLLHMVENCLGNQKVLKGYFFFDK